MPPMAYSDGRGAVARIPTMTASLALETPDDHSHVVRPAEMEWKKTRFPGCEVKGLLLDRKSGLVTALMRLAPGAVLPDHEHVKIEQTFMLEGTLVDKEGPVRSEENTSELQSPVH